MEGAWLFTSASSSLVGGMNLWMDMGKPKRKPQGRVRLSGETGLSGRLEYRVTDTDTGVETWGTVCNDGWEETFSQGQQNARVVCRMLDLDGGTVMGSAGEVITYTNASVTLPVQSEFAADLSTPVHAETFQCTGNEAVLEDCFREEAQNCKHKEDIVVRCDLPAKKSSPYFVDAVMKDGKGPLTWSEAAEYCVMRDFQLCSIDDYCPGGDISKTIALDPTVAKKEAWKLPDKVCLKGPEAESVKEVADQDLAQCAKLCQDEPECKYFSRPAGLGEDSKGSCKFCTDNCGPDESCSDHFVWRVNRMSTKQPGAIPSHYTGLWAPVSDAVNEWIQVGDKSTTCTSWINKWEKNQGPSGELPTGQVGRGSADAVDPDTGKFFRCCDPTPVNPLWSQIVTHWTRSYATRLKTPQLKKIYVDGVQIEQDKSRGMLFPADPLFPRPNLPIYSFDKQSFTAANGIRLTHFQNTESKGLSATCGDSGASIKIRVASMGASDIGSQRFGTGGPNVQFEIMKNEKDGYKEIFTGSNANGNGFSVILLDPYSGEKISAKTFDTDASNSADEELSIMLKTAPEYSIVLISAHSQVVPPARGTSIDGTSRGMVFSETILNQLTGGYSDDRTARGNGETKDTPGADCTFLFKAGKIESKAYWIKPVQNKPAVRVWCDMVGDTKRRSAADGSNGKVGGGWTLVYKNSGTSNMRTSDAQNVVDATNTDATAVGALDFDAISDLDSGKLSDDYIKELCSDQFMVMQTDELQIRSKRLCVDTAGKKTCSGSGVEGDSIDGSSCETHNDCAMTPLFCRFSDLYYYGDAKKTIKYCSLTYDSTGGYVDAFGGAEGFGTTVNTASVQTSNYYNTANNGSKIIFGEPSHGSELNKCSENGGCFVQVYCKSRLATQKRKVNYQGSFALISQIVQGDLPEWKRFNTLEALSGPSEVETTIPLIPISQKLFVGGVYRHIVPESPFNVGVFRIYNRHLTEKDIRANFNALAKRYGKTELENGGSRRALSGTTTETSQGPRRNGRALQVTSTVKAFEASGVVNENNVLVRTSFSKNLPEVGDTGDFVEIFRATSRPLPSAVASLPFVASLPSPSPSPSLSFAHV